MPAFEKANPTILKNEGGYVNDPNDAGGETNFGISKRSFPDVDIKNLTREKAVAIYRTSFWSKHPDLEKLDSQEIATKTFDLMVNMGPARGIRILQEAINDANAACVVGADGRMGPETVRRANELDEAKLLKAMQVSAARFYCGIVQRKPTQEKFLRTWLLRAYDRPFSKSEPTPHCPDE